MLSPHAMLIVQKWIIGGVFIGGAAATTPFILKQFDKPDQDGDCISQSAVAGAIPFSFEAHGEPLRNVKLINADEGSMCYMHELSTGTGNSVFIPLTWHSFTIEVRGHSVNFIFYIAEQQRQSFPLPVEAQ